MTKFRPIAMIKLKHIAMAIAKQGPMAIAGPLVFRLIKTHGNVRTMVMAKHRLDPWPNKAGN